MVTGYTEKLKEFLKKQKTDGKEGILRHGTVK